MSDIVLWNPSEAVMIPPTATTFEAIASYALQLSKREINQIVDAMKAGNYEMGALFLWQKTMTGLKKQLSFLGMEFVGELLDRADIVADSVPGQVLTDYDAVRLAEELGMFTSTQALRLRNVLQTVAHFAESPTEDDEGDRQMMPEEAISCLRTCIQSVLGHQRLEGAIEFAKFRDELERRTFETNDREIDSLRSAPYFFQRTTLRVLMAIAKTAQGAQLEHALANTNVIIPLLWNELRKPDRWFIGRAYAEVHSEGRSTAASGLRKTLLKVRGFDYVPEDLRSRTFLSVAAEIQNAHFSFNNYYNEPGPVNKLESLGTTIPIPALAQCVTAVLCVRLGNQYGVSWAAQASAGRILSALTEQRWTYYLEESLPGDEIVLGKLMNETIALRWIELVNEHKLAELEVKNRSVRALLTQGNKAKPTLVIAAAQKLHDNLTNRRARAK
ncbi:MAG TPA: hypothetical protein VFV34_20495 [Blastocatellia bacterium]|nr:hypothetical protein [Blastocatellia bacterium]